MKPAAGTHISHYKILAEIGKGGMGEVYLAEDPALERKIAIKVLTDECCENDERLGRFMREAKTASSLNHPNIITIFEFGKHDGNHFIAAEFIDGRELRDLMKIEKLPLVKILDISIQVVSALCAAHDAGIIHRDIKPANIMIRRDGIAKVLDFGLAKLAVRTGEIGKRGPGAEDITLIAPSHPSQTPPNPASADTIPGLVLGTPKYMSPEQARGQELDLQTDIFSFGAVLYEMLAGAAPFRGASVSDQISAVLNSEPEPILYLNPELPFEVGSVVHRSLSKKKSTRYQSARELLDDLTSIKQKLDIEDHLSRTESLMVSKTDVQISDKPGNTIAVLPFANMSIGQRRDYFSEGLTEEIVVNLSKLRLLKVVPHGAAPASIGEGKTHKETAEVLGVRFLLEGSVRRQGDSLRISAQLVDTNENAYLWSETYHGTISDIFEIQEKVATEIAQALEVTLSPNEQAVLKKRFTENTEAYQLYLQGRYFWNKRTISGLDNAIKHFELAIESDPNYALAWAGIADSYSLLAEFGITPHKKLYPKAAAAIKRALELDDNLAEVHASYASILLFNKWDWSQSKKEFERALEINPSYATAHHWYSFWFLGTGNLEEAKRWICSAAELDPVSQAIMKDKGMVFYYASEFETAVELAKKTLQLDPDYPAAHRLLSLCYLAKGMFEESIESNAKWGELTGNSEESDFCRAHIYAASGKTDEALKLLDSIKQQDTKVDNQYRGFALVYISLGEFDSAFEMLEKSIDMHEIALLSLKTDPKMEPLRSDERFSKLLLKMGVR